MADIAIPYLFNGQSILRKDGTPESWFVNAWNALIDRSGGQGQDLVGVNLSGVNEINTNLADKYGVAVDGSNNGTVEGLDGTGALGGVLKLAAAVIQLDADAINFGDDTTFEDTYNTIYSESGAGTRVRILGPFPASGDLVLWWGPDSVALNSETKTNGILTLSEGDSDVYKDGVILGATTDPLVVSVTAGSLSASRADAGDLTATATIGATGGTSPYSFAYTPLPPLDTSQPDITYTDLTGTGIQIDSTSATNNVEADYVILVTVTDDDGNMSTQPLSGTFTWGTPP